MSVMKCSLGTQVSSPSSGTNTSTTVSLAARIEKDVLKDFIIAKVTTVQNYDVTIIVFVIIFVME